MIFKFSFDSWLSDILIEGYSSCSYRCAPLECTKEKPSYVPVCLQCLFRPGLSSIHHPGKKRAEAFPNIKDPRNMAFVIFVRLFDYCWLIVDIKFHFIQALEVPTKYWLDLTEPCCARKEHRTCNGNSNLIFPWDTRKQERMAIVRNNGQYHGRFISKPWEFQVVISNYKELLTSHICLKHPPKSPFHRSVSRLENLSSVESSKSEAGSLKGSRGAIVLCCVPSVWCSEFSWCLL